MKKIVLLLTLMFVLGFTSYGQSASATYTAGDIQTDRGFTSLPGASGCPGTLTVTIPEGVIITGVDVVYDMTAAAGAWKNEQRSQLRCVSPGGTDEATLESGVGSTGGTFSYSRTGLDIANGVTGGGDIGFELHAGRTWGGSGCSTQYNKVDNNSWTVTVHYLIPGAPGIPSNPTPADNSNNIAVDGSLTWDFGADTDTYDLWFGPAGDMEKVVDGADAFAIGSYSYADLEEFTNYEWQVVAHNEVASVSGPVWSFTTQLAEGLVVIGDGSVTDLHLPINTFYAYNYSQVLYYQEEINVANKRIEKLYYYFNGFQAGTNYEDWTIYMGHTDKTVFNNTSDWVPYSSLVKVFEGKVNITAEEGWVEIVLDNPFIYNNTDNLVIAVNETTPGYGSSAAGFYGTQTPGIFRGLLARRDTSPYNPASPPNATTRPAGYANIMLYLEDLSDEPIFTINPESKDFDEIGLGEQSPAQVFTISNFGMGVLGVEAPVLDNDSDFILIYDEEDFPAELATSEIVTFSVIFAPDSDGYKTGEVEISYSDETKGSFTVELEGTGIVRPAGSTCGNPFVVSLPLVNYEDNTEDYGNDYSSSWVDPVDVYLSGYDFVAQFTLESASFLNGSVSGEYTGLLILKDCPNLENPAELIVTGTGSTGGDFSQVLLEAGTYYAIVSTFPSPDYTDFTLNLSSVPASTITFEVTDEDTDEPIENALVTISENGNLVETKNTDEDGLVVFVLEEGSYSYSITFIGYYPIEGVHFEADVNQTIEVEMTSMPPIFSATPESHDFGTVALGSESATQVFTIANTGGGILTIEDVGITGDAYFALTDGNTYPLELGPQQTTSVSVVFAPQSEGVKSAILQITDDQPDKAVHEVALLGMGFDATISEFPHFEDFDAFTPPDLPVGWEKVVNSNAIAAAVQTASTNPYSDPNHVQIFNSWDSGAELLLITPPIEGDLNDLRVRFYASGGAGFTLEIGTMPSAAGDFNLIETLSIPGGYAEYSVSFNDYGGTDSRIAFKHGLGGTYRIINIDDVTIQEIPTVPVFAVSPQSWDYGEVAIGEESEAQVFTIYNDGAGSLTAETPTLDNHTDFILEFDAGDYPATLEPGETVTFSVMFVPQSEGEKSGEITIGYDDATKETFTVELEGTGFIRPPGSTCENPYVIDLPLVDYQDNTFAYGNDYQSSWIDPPSDFLNGHDFVIRFTLDRPALLTGSVEGPWTGLIILQDCPDQEDPAERLGLAIGNFGGTINNLLLEAGTYFAIVSTWPTPDYTDFTLNLSAELLYVMSFTITDEATGGAVEDAEIAVDGIGMELTDADGLAAFLLPDGEYDVTITADGFLQYAGSVTVDGDDVDVDAIAMKPLYQVGFEVQNADESPLMDVELAIEGYYQGYDDAPVAFSQLLHTGADGQADVLLPDGSYSYTASLIGYLDESDTFVVEGDEEMIGVTLNQAPPTLAVDPEAHDFGGVLIGQESAPQTFRLFNSGSGILTIDGVELGGNDQAMFILTDENEYPEELETGQEITISVVFSPDSEGEKNAELLIATGNSEKEAFVIPLVGEGIDPTITEFPWLEDFTGEGFPPLGWSIVNAQGSSITWYLYTYYGYPTSAGHEWGSFGEAQEGWLITPPVAIPAGGEFELAFSSLVYYPEDYGKNSVLISTGSSDPADEGFVEVWTPESVEEEWVETVISLDDYGGQTIYIAFLYEGTYAHGWYVDYVGISALHTTHTIWLGTAGSDWHSAGNWSDDVPGSGDDAIIPSGTTHYPTISAGAEVNDLTIESGASLLDNGHLTIHGDFIMEREIDDVGLAWHFLSAPVSGMTIIGSDFVPEDEPLPGNFDFYYFDESVALPWINIRGHGGTPNDDFDEFSALPWINIRGHGGTPNEDFDEFFVPGKGYLVAYDHDYGITTFQFTGTMQTGDIEYTLACTAEEVWSGWNLLGNPYPSAIQWQDAYAGQFQQNAVAIYDPYHGGGGGYVYIEEDAYIPANQGFFALVKDTEDESDFTFTNAMRAHGGDFMKKDVPAVDQLTLRLESNAYWDKTTVRIRGGSDYSRDRQDAAKLFSLNADVPQLYSKSSDQVALSINSIPKIDQEQPIALGMRIPADGEYTLSLQEVAGAFVTSALLLEDTYKGIIRDLHGNPGYVFGAEEGDDAGRFILHFDAPTDIDDVEELTIQTWYHDGNLFVNNHHETAEVLVYDISGRRMYRFVAGQGEHQYRLNLRAGVYIVHTLTQHSAQSMRFVAE